MKPTPRSLCGLLLAVSLTGTLARATDVPPQGVIKHVIIVIMENRTPDNLFYGDTILYNNDGNVRPPVTPKCRPDPTKLDTYDIPLVSMRLDTCYDTRHHDRDWLAMYDKPPEGGPGRMAGACLINIANEACAPACQTKGIPGIPKCPQYTYVANPSPTHPLEPYFQIANQYGFANYMFQTNQGPSFPAHQFLFGGTSLPVPFSQDPVKSKWFAMDNVSRDPIPQNQKVGCIAKDSARVRLIDDSGNQPPACTYGQDNEHCVYPCLDHKTLLNVIDSTAPRLSWTYYAHSPADFWEAPAAVLNVCGPNLPPPNGTSCTNSQYTDHVVFPIEDVDESLILTDIENCNLPNVSWVIPDGR